LPAELPAALIISMGLADAPPDDAKPAKRAFFPATHWTEIAAAHGTDADMAARAMESLCRTYLPAIEKYLRWFRNLPGDPHELANEFMAHFIHQDSLRRVDPARGKFRNYLLGALKMFLRSKWRDEARIPVHLEFDETLQETVPGRAAEADFDRNFAELLIHTAVKRVKQRFAGSRVEPQIPILLPYLGVDPPTETMKEVAERLGVSADLIYQNFKRLRTELFRQLRIETQRHLGPMDDVDEEIQAMLRAFAKE
jgi:DNA-directed RNA polymerase specialized sigma24 family protein